MVIGKLRYLRIPESSISQLEDGPGIFVAFDADVYSEKRTTHLRLFTTEVPSVDGVEEYDFPSGKWKAVFR